MLHSGRKKFKESADNPKVDNKYPLSYDYPYLNKEVFFVVQWLCTQMTNRYICILFDYSRGKQ